MKRKETTYRPVHGEMICPPPPMAVDPKIAADLRPSVDESAFHTSLVAGGGYLQAAGVAIA